MSPLACMTPEIIPGYTIRERIGAGGYGEVWKADAPGGLVKAIKFVYGRLDGERATRELKALSRIKEVRHPFLLSLERIEVIDGQLVIVTELADASLMNRFEQCVAAGSPGIPRHELLVYLSDAADALDYMRQTFSLQHLDIKPENLLILSGRVKVADFGLVKDIHDATVSLVGGLTPIYAAPEVFAGRPSLHSDQYSLAIVYQELLTGVLPFSGRDHAQLATQHRCSSPRLAPLPPDDRPIIARALAKNPEDRFPSCRDLVDQLRSGAGSDKSAVCGDMPSAASKGIRGDTSATKTVDTVSHQQKKHDKQKSPSAVVSDPTISFDGIARPPGSVTGHFTSALPGLEFEPSPSTADEWPLVFTEPADSIKDLPPLETVSGAWRLRPCLVLGLGGTAGRVLNCLRQRWSDRFGDLAAVPALQMLLVDSDRRSLSRATGGDPSRALGPSETLALPLRSQEEYYEAPEKYLLWLRRRWLCRIPRSHCTEGLRPLGRLALVDHGPELIAQLKRAISAMTSPEAIATSGQRIGEEILAEAPQIILVASISGGTGSGMLLDATYAVRKVLADLSISDARLTGVLLHSTGRSPHDKLLARANACACLRELQHFGRGEGYPGDDDFGLPAFAGEIPPFDTTRVVHLGDGLNPEEFDQAAENVGQFLDLATATAGGVFFDSDHEPGESEMTVRTFGMCRVGRTQKEFVAKAADLLCHKAIQGWLSEAQVDSAELLKNLQSELMGLIAAFAETADNDIVTFHDAAHPELAVKFDQEWRTTILGGPGEPSAPLEKQGPARGNLLEQLQPAGRAMVLDTLRRDGFRELLPGGLRESPLEAGLLKRCLESAAPRLDACGGSRRLWLIGTSDSAAATLQAAIELDTMQVPSVAIDSRSDFVVGWEIEGMSLPRVAAHLVDNQRDAAQLALRLHTRLDIDW
ncbi:MAG: tubulin-like doman-containing protein [Thermoguttaceae bacterium]